MKKLLFLANIQHGEAPTGGGVQTRNQYMLRWFQQRYDTKFYDTWQKSAFVSLVSSILLTLFYHNRLIVVSYGIRGAKALARVFDFFHIERNILLFVPGGDVLKFVSEKDVKTLSFYDKIFVQGNYLKEALNKCGFTNIFYCPNFKEIDYYPTHIAKTGNIRFVYVGRLLKEKGIDVMLEAFKKIENTDCSLTIYGKETENYNRDYFSSLNCENLFFKGYLDLKQKDGYDELASYDVLVFPTYYEGEGFPGTLVDALICGLPVIATDFNANTEIISDKQSGIIVPANNPEILRNAMLAVINGEENLHDLSDYSRREASKYDIDSVLTPIFRNF